MSSFGCKVGRAYSATDARGVSLGLQTQTDRVPAFDAFVNAAARMGWGTPNLAEAAEYVLERLSNNYPLLLTLYRNHWLSRKIVDTPAKDMVRAWPSLNSEIHPGDNDRIDQAIRRTRTKSSLLQALKWARLYGGSGALIVIEGHEDRLEEPLKVDEIQVGAYRGLIPFDRWTGITPAGEICTDISKPLEFNFPEFYDVNVLGGGKGRFRVHSSRVLRFLGPDVPAPENQAQQWWGISVLEPCYEEIRKRDNMSWNILSLTFRAQLLAMKTKDLAQMLSGAGMNAQALQMFYQRMSAMNHLMSNQNMVVLPEEGGLDSINYTFSGLSDVYQQFQLDIAGAAGQPVSRLFGRTISGLGQSNDADERIYEETVAMEQEEIRPQMERLYAIVCQSEIGEVPEDFTLKFPSVRVLTEEERSKLASDTATNVNTLFVSGIFKKSMALKELRQSSDATGFGTNITDEDIEAADAEPDLMGGEFGEEPAGENLREMDFAGVPVAVETPRGARRTIKRDDGTAAYDRMLQFDYGYIRETTGRDGDEIDVILGPDQSADRVFIVDMHDLGPDVEARGDEDKVLLGFADEAAAKAAFLSMYPPEFLGGMTEISLDEFRSNWLGADLARAA